MGEIQKEEQKTQMFRYKNASLPTQERVNDMYFRSGCIYVD